MPNEPRRSAGASGYRTNRCGSRHPRSYEIFPLNLRVAISQREGLQCDVSHNGDTAMQTAETVPEFDSVIVAGSQKSCTAAHDGVVSAISYPQNRREPNCAWISSTRFGQCDLMDEDNTKTFPKEFLLILDMASSDLLFLFVYPMNHRIVGRVR
jgi:hypothetical protein